MMIHSLPTCSEFTLAPFPSSRTCYRRGWLSGFWQLTGVTGAYSSESTSAKLGLDSDDVKRLEPD